MCLRDTYGLISFKLVGYDRVFWNGYEHNPMTRALCAAARRGITPYIHRPDPSANVRPDLGRSDCDLIPAHDIPAAVGLRHYTESL